MKLEKIIAESAIFGRLSESKRATLTEVTRYQSFRKGETVFEEGAVASDFVLLGSGRVKIIKRSAAGKEQIIHVFGPQEVVGEAAVFSDTCYPATCVAMTDLEVGRISRRDLLNLIQESPQMAMDLLAIFAERLQYFNRLLGSVALDEAPVRLARYLAEYYREKGVPEFQLALPKGELATTLGMTPETLSRSLSRLKQQGIIAVERSTIRILNEDSLNQLL